MSTILPKKLAVFYGWPSGVNATFSVPGAVNVFKDYELVVFGAGLEDPSHGDHANTVAIINDPLMVNTQVFGYIDATLPLDTVQNKIDLWYFMGVSGIFYDQFGFDYGLTREKQRELVWSVHEKGDNTLKCFVNAWVVDDAFSPDVHVNNPNGLATRLDSRDIYLAESFAIINSAYDDADSDSNGIKDWQDKAAKMVSYKSTYGTEMAAVTTSDASPFDQAKADYSYFASTLNGFDYWGYGEDLFSSVSAQLPFRTRKSFYGNKFDGAVSINGNVYERRTNVGIHLNTSSHSVDVLLD